MRAGPAKGPRRYSCVRYVFGTSLRSRHMLTTKPEPGWRWGNERCCNHAVNIEDEQSDDRYDGETQERLAANGPFLSAVVGTIDSQPSVAVTHRTAHPVSCSMLKI